MLLVSTSVGAFTVDPAMRCDGPVVVFDTSIRELRGDPEPVVDDIVTRLRQYVRRTCGPRVEVHEVLLPGATRQVLVPAVLERLGRDAPAVAIVHSPYADVEAGATPQDLLDVYRRILAACERAGTTCLVGGQQPVDALSAQAIARQLEIEQSAAEAFPEHYVQTYRHLGSRLASRRLMMRLDKGDGRVLNDRGHELLYHLFQRRLIALAGQARSKRP